LLATFLPPLQFLVIDYWRGKFGKHKKAIRFLNVSDPFVKYRESERNVAGGKRGVRDARLLSSPADRSDTASGYIRVLHLRLLYAGFLILDGTAHWP
jgi:hypothetical protein